MIKLIIFDMAGVCTTNEDDLYFPKLLKGTGVDHKQFKRDYDELIFEAEAGEVFVAEVWKRLKENYAIYKNIKQIMKEHMEERRLLPSMTPLLLALREKYKLAYFTNLAKEYHDLFLSMQNQDRYFDMGLASYMVKARKTELVGFEYLMEYFECSPNETIVIDDGEQYLVQPRKIGMHTILFKNRDQLIEDLAKLGVHP